MARKGAEEGSKSEQAIVSGNQAIVASVQDDVGATMKGEDGRVKPIQFGIDQVKPIANIQAERQKVPLPQKWEVHSKDPKATSVRYVDPDGASGVVNIPVGTVIDERFHNVALMRKHKNIELRPYVETPEEPEVELDEMA